jgi:non-specific serine/threonine protein kinase
MVHGKTREEINMMGRTVSHYRVLKEVGSGGMGVVYQAEDIRLGRHVAVKFFSNRSFGDQEALERFHREARAASSLNHSSICTVHDIGEFEGHPFIVLEYLDGSTLAERLKDETFEPDRVIDLGLQITDALQAAHLRGIVHRDIKPGNIFLTRANQIKILDFGLAKLTVDPLDSISSMPTANGSAGLTTPGTTMGTVSYMSPEQARGEVLDPRTDLFSLGVVLYEMATGTLPFRGKTAPVVFSEILSTDPPDPGTVRASIPDPLSHVIMKLLEKDREVRYQSAAEVQVDLRRLRRDLDTGRFTTAGSLDPPATKIRWNWRVGFAGLLLLLLAVVTVAAMVWFSSNQEPTGKAIAVLPFAMLGQDSDGEQFSDGLATAIMTKLSQVPRLRVASRSAALRFRGDDKTPREIGAEIGVVAVLDGTVQRQGQRVRIAAQLIDVESDTHIWAESYDRDISDILAIEDEIAREITAALQLRLVPHRAAGLDSEQEENLTAYDFYLMGRSYYKLGLLDEAEQRLARAKALDPEHFSFPQLLLARIYEAQGRPDLALSELDEFSRLHPNSEMAEDLPEWKDAIQLSLKGSPLDDPVDQPVR